MHPGARTDTCKYLTLIPTPEDTQVLRRLMMRSKETGDSNDFDELLNYMRGDNENAGMGRAYEPHCQKHDGLCICMESVVISQREFAGNFQPMWSTYSNRDRIRTCEHREVERQTSDGCLPYDFFLAEKITQAIGTDLIDRLSE